jgi:Putative peptidoglycan binding domain
VRLPAALARFLTVVWALLLVAAVAQAQITQSSDQPSSKSSSHPASAKPVSKSLPQKTVAKHKTSRRTTANWRKRGQQKIDADRATEIQQALIRERYLSGMPSGVWDDATQKAMQRYQGDNGWQNKSTPDARALIKLGLGPDHQHLLNPESAMTTAAQPEGRPAGTATTAPSPVARPRAPVPSAVPAPSTDPASLPPNK